MAILRLSTTARNALANALKTAIDAGAGAGTIKLYTGSQPATPQDAPTGTLVATIAFGDPSFGAASGGVITANAIAAVSATGAGTVGYARIADSDGNAIMDVDAGTSGATINLSSLTFTINDTVTITSATLTVPQ